MNSVESWSDSMQGGFDSIGRALSYPKCKVGYYFILTNIISIRIFSPGADICDYGNYRVLCGGSDILWNRHFCDCTISEFTSREV